MTYDEIRAYLADPASASPATRLLGFELLDFSIEQGWATMQFMPGPTFINPIGTVQGGFVTTMLDEAMGLAACINLRFACVVPTLSLTTHYLRPTLPGRVTARGEVVRMGTTTAFLAGELKSSEGVLLATATAATAVRALPRAHRVGSS
jgi:uncharacterized protein (TIGR00369 family)